MSPAKRCADPSEESRLNLSSIIFSGTLIITLTPKYTSSGLNLPRAYVI